ncbi:1,5-anhydro-D-fructose reductase [Tritrichomonas foetus]|uniref:1,5-anhydro-D-fructose reductase n=1 Tax=Tritrichomonas foetus TaxID=1144522 RepID=A0A1J4J6A1_9EUKA|nr:1,5-anhydro-D-fructose reductase [Tritrichomonas foetus]|eukprot:OHS92973.1 1,5-anhydro-D-fructose reductase [Tritrichomonas foetus]
MDTFPRNGLGTLNMPNNESGTEAVRCAIEDAGYRMIDCAVHYNNHEAVGRAFHDVLTRGVVKREELWITTKLPNYRHKPEEVEAECRQNLKDLQLDYLDLYLVHWPISYDEPTSKQIATFPLNDYGAIAQTHVPFIDTWNEMEKLVEKGLVKHIGVCNMTIEMLERIRYEPRVKIQPYVNQVECHLYMQQGPLVDYCTKRKMHITGFFLFGGDGHIPGPRLLEDPVLQEVAKEVGRPAGSVAIKFVLNLSPIMTVIVKSSSLAHQKSNLNTNFELTEDQMNRLRSRQRFRYANEVEAIYKSNIFSDAY